MKSKKTIRILAIETSCDETAAAVVEATKSADGFGLEILSNVVASQIDLHKKWGGVYPELASRAHLEAMIPVLQEALEPLACSQRSAVSGQKDLKKLKADSWKLIAAVDAIAVTVGPGLIGSLLMGVETAQILASYYSLPVVPVNHLEGHIYSAFAGKQSAISGQRSAKLKNDSWGPITVPKTDLFPILALVVSGGHTSLILMKDHLKYETVGQTIDDAAGEAFDKVARIMKSGYPGGPAIEKISKLGNENTYKLPLSMVGRKNLDFSFSGLKTAVLYLTKDPKTQKKLKYNKADLAASFQKTVCEILTRKTIQAIKKYQPKTVILSGGVSANQYLRDYFVSGISKLQTANYQPPTILIPPKPLSTDNAVGIGIVGAIKFLSGQKTGWEKIEAKDQFPIDSKLVQK